MARRCRVATGKLGLARAPRLAACAAIVLASAQLAAQDTPAAPVEQQPATPASGEPADASKPAEQPKPATPAGQTAPSDLQKQSAEHPIYPPPPKASGFGFHVGDFDINLGGYIKVDLIHDFQDINDDQQFDVRDIPVSGGTSPGSNTNLQASQTRLNLDIRGPSSDGDMRVFVEGDFFGSNNSFRMRHAYGQFRQLLAGQTWSTFMDEDAMPETLDFESPIAFPQVRTAQVRYSIPLENKDYFAVAVEDPDSEIIAPTGVDGASKNPLPDFTARLRLNNPIGHVQLGMFTGMARFVPDDATAEDAWLWGVNLSTKLTTVDKDNAIVQLTYGPGAGRYRGGVTAAPDNDNDLEAVPVFGYLASYQHFWNEKYRSSIGYAEAHADVPGGAPPTTTNESLTYGFVNFIWQYTNRSWVGVELLHGTREVESGADGHDTRLQFSFRFDI
ncbi:MAG TPA: DcaP family trimeric outer membrane transporter [Planctomycetota bacterium]|nr:DcaP family trimeric outer membrane transporter [Planctomycetota bacterium]